MFKYAWCSLVLAFWCPTTAPGASLAYEGFDYVAATPLTGQNGGSGFPAPWSADPGVIVQPPGLSIAVALPSTGLSIGGGFNAARQLATSLNQTEYWASFQIQANPGNDQVYLGFDVIPSTTPLISFGRILNKYFIRQGSSTTVQGGVASASGVTDLLVARFRQSGPFTVVDLWVNTVNFALPPLLSLSVPSVPYTWVNLQVQPGFLADEVRIGTTPGDVAAQTNPSLPVYQVTQAGATVSQGTTLANYLNIPTNMVVQTNGWVAFVDPSNHLAVPSVPVTDPVIISNLLSGTRNLYPNIPIQFQAIDFAALANLPVLDDNSALGSTSNALSSSELTPQFGTPVVGHTRFTAFYTNDTGTVISNTQYLDTLVSYQFSLPGGYPLVGPGAQVQVAFGPTGNVTRLLYSARQLTPGPLVQIISAAEAGRRAAALFPANAQIGVQLVYWAPPLWFWQNPLSTWHPNTIIPWYACTASVSSTDPITGMVSFFTLKTRMIPATDISDFVPTLNLATGGSTQVVASVSVTGGTPPYTYLWAGSDPRVSATTGSSISYTPTRRLAPPALAFAVSGGNAAAISWPYPSPGFDLESSTDLLSGRWSAFTGRVQTNNDLYSVSVNLQGQSTFFRLRFTSQTLAATDTVGVNVIDANGVSASGSQVVPVQVVPDRPAYPGPPKISYGTESPNEPSFAVDRVGWQNGMAIPGGGGGSESFCWMGDSAWPGDFIEPPTPGIFVSTPWVYGDADYSGINTASIVLNNTDGAPDFFCSSVPGAASADYNTAGLTRPGNPGWNVVINLKNNKGTSSTHAYNISYYKYSWGPLGPNDFLNWLCMDCCDALDETGPGGTSPKRWGPAFGGLHILTGFNSGEAVADGSFEYDFARYMLKPPYPWTQPLPIVGSWFLAAFVAGFDDHGRPAAMGPIGPGAVSDYWDHYWGKGPVNPTIPPSKITGWWYETSP